MKTAELTGKALDWAVAKCEFSLITQGGRVAQMGNQLWTSDDDGEAVRYQPSTDWSQGGPIIEREGIEIRKGNPLYFPQGNEQGDYYEDLWIASKQQDGLPPGMRGVYERWGTTPLIAAMRCYVVSKLGDEVEIPEELI